MSKTARSTLAIGAMATAAAFAMAATLIAPYFIKSLNGERRNNKQLPSGKRKNENDIPKGQRGSELLVDVNNDDDDNNDNNVVKIPFVSFPWQTTKPSMSDISRYAGNVTISTNPSRPGQPSSDDANRNRTSKAAITANNTNGSTESSSSLQDIMATMTFAYSKLRAPSCPCCQ